MLVSCVRSYYRLVTGYVHDFVSIFLPCFRSHVRSTTGFVTGLGSMSSYVSALVTASFRSCGDRHVRSTNSFLDVQYLVCWSYIVPGIRYQHGTYFVPTFLPADLSAQFFCVFPGCVQGGAYVLWGYQGTHTRA